MGEYFFPKEVKSFASYLVFQPYKWQFDSVKNVGTMLKVKESLDKIILYAPGGINEGYNAKWESESILFDSSSAEGFAKTLVKGIAQKVADKTKAVSIAQATKGVTIAPNDMLIYKGNEHLTLSFEFDLTPTNQIESNQVQQIIKKFKDYSVGDFNSQSGQIFIDYPPIFTIQLMTPLNNPNSYSTKGSKNYLFHEKMALTSTNVSYSPNSESLLTYYDGTPVTAHLSLNFMSVLPVFDNKGGK